MDTLEENKGNFQQETIRGLVVLYYKNYLTHSPNRVSNAWGLCYVLAKRFKDKNYTDRLDHIYKKTSVGFPLGLVETVAYRDLMLGKSIDKYYNYGYGKRSILLGDLIQALHRTMSEISDIFTDICVQNEIDTNIVAPELFLTGLDPKGGM